MRLGSGGSWLKVGRLRPDHRGGVEQGDQCGGRVSARWSRSRSAVEDAIYQLGHMSRSRLTVSREWDGRQVKLQSCQRGHYQRWLLSAIHLSRPRRRLWSSRPMSSRRIDLRPCRWSRSWMSWRSQRLPTGHRSKQRAGFCWIEERTLSKEERGYRQRCMEISLQLNISLAE